MSSRIVWSSLIFPAILALSPTVTHAEISAANQQATAVSTASATALTARFETRVTPIHTHDKGEHAVKASQSEWYFIRSANAVETRDLQGSRSEYWLLGSNGKVYYKKLYHAQKKSVEIFPGDQDMMGHFQWDKVSTMLNQQDLAALKKVGTTRMMGEPAEIRTGVINGAKVQLTWLTESQLPAKLIRRYPDKVVSLTMSNRYSAEKSPVQITSTDTIQSYDVIDMADFGDMEDDPFIRSVMTEASANGQAGHSHSH